MTAKNNSRLGKAEIETIIDNLPSIIIVLNSNLIILLANKMASRFAKKPKADFVGMKGGDAFLCVRSKDCPRVCGYGPACKQCFLRNTVEETFGAGRDCSMVEGQMEFEGIGCRWLQVSTTYLKSNNII